MRDMPHAAAHGGRGGGRTDKHAATTGEIMRAFAGGLARPTDIVMCYTARRKMRSQALAPRSLPSSQATDDVAAAVAGCSCDIILHLAQSTEARWQTSNLNHR